MPTKKPDAITEQFLRESNYIENEYDEQAYIDALAAWNFIMRKEVLSIDVIYRCHKMLMKNRKTLKESEKGTIRDCAVAIYSGGKKIRDLMPHTLIAGELWHWSFEMMRKHPAPEWKELHVQYEYIHPFVDGNGRTGRMFMNWCRIKRCGLPILVIKESQKKDYYKWFN